jgi:hypothetical protein
LLMRKSGKDLRGKLRSKKNNGPSIQRDLSRTTLPALVDQLGTGFVYRFVATNNFGGSLTVTYQMLLDAWLIAGTATTAYQLFDFVKIKKVTIRSMGVAQPYVAGTSLPAPPMATVGIEFPGLTNGIVGDGRQKSDSQIGYDVPAMVSLSPDPESQSAQFQANSSNIAFVVRAVDQNLNPLSGTMIDVQVVLKNSADVSPAAPLTARTGMNSGNLYFGGLDGLASAATTFRSVFVPRI